MPVKLLNVLRVYALHFDEQIFSQNAKACDFRGERVMRRKPLSEFYDADMGRARHEADFIALWFQRCGAKRQGNLSGVLVTLGDLNRRPSV